MTLPVDWCVMMTATQRPHLSSNIPELEKMSQFIIPESTEMMIIGLCG